MTRKEIIRLAQMIYGDHYTEQDIVFGKLVANTERLNLRTSMLDILEGKEDCEEVKSEQFQRYLELVAVDEWSSTEAVELRSVLEQQKCDLRYVDMVIENRKWELGGEMHGREIDENAAIFGIKYPALQFALNAPSSETTEIRRLLEQEKMKMVLEQWPEDVTSHTAIQGGVLCARTVSVFDLIRCAEIVDHVKGGA